MIKYEYLIKTINIKNDSVSVNSDVWDSVEQGTVACETWKGFAKAPKTDFRIIRVDGGFFVKLHTEECDLRAEVTVQNGDIYQDSCMELFLSPDSADGRYLNFEFNPKGILHLGIGEGRPDRLLIDATREIFKIESVANDGDWSLLFYIPDEFLLKYFAEISNRMMGNFYKCGELTGHSHFSSWAPIDTDRPDFHRPEFFGSLVVSE
ncbi:MAG: hypothetical protein E7384_05075 [Ruminococcaceae bacterium]|nr:hypothetical protein [Oscillospiraceae bacterium]